MRKVPDKLSAHVGIFVPVMRTKDENLKVVRDER